MKNLSDFDPDLIPGAEGMKFGIVVADWNREITGKMLRGALQSLEQAGARTGDIHVHHVPGSFELPMGARMLAEALEPDAVICIGCVVQGETRHFDYICQGVTQGITELNLKYDLPFIFGVLTTDTYEQAADRAGGKHGNKGEEAAITAIRMAGLKRHLKS